MEQGEGREEGVEQGEGEGGAGRGWSRERAGSREGGTLLTGSH